MGGAALVYDNLKSLGVDVEMYDTLEDLSVKTRIICDGHYITRIDEDKNADGARITKNKTSRLFLLMILLF